MGERRLSDKERQFAEAIVGGANPSEAARRIGYDEKESCRVIGRTPLPAPQGDRRDQAPPAPHERLHIRRACDLQLGQQNLRKRPTLPGRREVCTPQIAQVAATVGDGGKGASAPSFTPLSSRSLGAKKKISEIRAQTQIGRGPVQDRQVPEI